ncbi:MAG: glycosyltransferase [Nitrospirae bacterium]|nr:MAG: glycosyltransferase [Nitrospirota bacterium]
MTIAVIIPTLNEAPTLQRLLPGVIALGFEEIVVVDGGSHDQTLARAASIFEQHAYPHGRCVPSARGRAVQMNTGAATCRSDILLFLHADTQLPVEAKSIIQRALRDPAAVGGRFDVRFEHDRGYAWLVSRMMNFRSRWTGIATGDQAIFVRRSVFERLGGFPEIPIMEDIEFSRRLKRMGRMCALREHVITSFRRWERQGPLRTILQMWALRFLYWAGCHPQTLTRFYGAVR